MAAASNKYGKALAAAMNGHINWGADTIKMALMTSGYTPNLGSDQLWSGISANEITGTGYTAGGATLGSPTATETVANSWTTTWAATNAQVYGDVVRPTVGNGLLYMAVIPAPGAAAANTGASQPTWPTVVGQTVADGSVTWACMGESITIFSSGSVSWASSTITAYYGVIYDATTGYLINLQTFTGAETDTNGTFVVAPDAVYGWWYEFPS